MRRSPSPVTYKYVEVGTTLYQALSTRTPRFPSRLAYSMLKDLFVDRKNSVTLYDPFCGHGVILVVAYLFFPQHIHKLLGSDINPIVVNTARQNFQWLREKDALEERLYAIQNYKTSNDTLKAEYQQKCRLMFNHAQGINLDVKLFRHDAQRVDSVLASIEGDVVLVTDPPYARNDHWHPKAGIAAADFGPLEPFLQRVTNAPNVSTMWLCYRTDQPIRPLLETYFTVTLYRGTKGRAIYQCHRK